MKISTSVLFCITFFTLACFGASKNADQPKKPISENSVQNIFADAIRKVTPTVVLIRLSDWHIEPKGSFFYEPAHYDILGIGAGLIVDQRGATAYILTNWHVASVSNRIDIRFSTGKWLTARILGAHLLADLTLLEVSVPASWGLLPKVTFAKVQSHVGDRGIAEN